MKPSRRAKKSLVDRKTVIFCSPLASFLRAFPQFLVVGYEHGIERRGQSRCVERLCAVRRAVPQELGGFTAHRP
jgi:hypothetical protein